MPANVGAHCYTIKSDKVFSLMLHLLHFYTAQWLVLTNYKHHITLPKKSKGIYESHSHLFPCL